MSRKRHKPEEIVAKLRQVDVLVAQGTPVADAIRTIGVTEVTYYRWRQAPRRTVERRDPIAGARLRDELLNGEIFYSLQEAKVVIESWRRHYNTVRPHASLGHRLRRCLCPPLLPGRLRHPDRLRRPGTR